MAKINPQFADLPKYNKVEAAPVRPGDNMAGQLLDAGKVFQDYYNSSLDRELQKKKIAGQEYLNQNAPYEAQKLRAEAQKAMAEAQNAKAKADILNDLYDTKTQTSDVAPPTPISSANPSLPLSRGDAFGTQGTPATPAPQPIKTHNVTVNDTGAPPTGAAPPPPAQTLEQARSAVDAIPETKTQAQIDKELAKAQKAYGHGIIDKGAYDLIEHNLVVEPQLQKFGQELLNFHKENKRDPNNVTELMGIINKASPDGKLYDEDSIKKRLDKLGTQTEQSLQERKFTQGQRENLGTDLSKGEVVKIGKAFNRVMDALDPETGGIDIKKDPAAFKGLQGMANLVEPASALGTVINIAGLGINKAFEVQTGMTDIQGMKLRQSKEVLDSNKDVKRAILNPKFQKLAASLFDIISADLRKTGGTALTATEVQGFLNKIGLTVWNGDPGQLIEGLNNYRENLKTEISNIKSKYEPDVIKKFDIPEITNKKLIPMTDAEKDYENLSPSISTQEPGPVNPDEPTVQVGGFKVRKKK